MNLIDFIIGVLIANSLAHFILGMTKTHFLGMFGYSSKGNIAYSILQFIVALILLFINYEWKSILQNGFVLGGLAVLIIYILLGHFLLAKFSKKN